MPSRHAIVFMRPTADPHDDPARIIGRRTTCASAEHTYLRNHDVVIVAVLKPARRDQEGAYLTSDREILGAGGVDADDRVEVAPILRGRVSFATSDPRATDLACFAHLGADAGQQRGSR